MVAQTIEGRMLCASRLAYDITDAGKIDSSGPYLEGADFVVPPKVFIEGLQHINAALVGENVDGLVLAFRGTLPGPHKEPLAEILADWEQDFDLSPANLDEIPGVVHAGFLKALDSLWTDIAPLLTDKTPKRILITGHSKGGAMAHLAAARLATLVNDARISVFAFGTPRLGDRKFALAYKQLVPSSLRFECRDEIAPYLPPSLAVRRLFRVNDTTAVAVAESYEVMGELRYVSWEGKVVPETPGLEAERRSRLEALLFSLDFKRIGDDHRIDCSYWYMRVICPTGVCPDCAAPD